MDIYFHETCITIMYWQKLFLLFTHKKCLLINNNVYIILGGTYLQWISTFMKNFKFNDAMVLEVQLFNKIKRKNKTKNLKF